MGHFRGMSGHAVGWMSLVVLALATGCQQEFALNLAQPGSARTFPAGFPGPMLPAPGTENPAPAPSADPTTYSCPGVPSWQLADYNGHGPFVDQDNLVGQAWRESNVVTISGLSGPAQVTLSHWAGNDYYTLNGQQHFFDRPVSVCAPYTATFTVQNGDQLQVALVSNVGGLTHQTMHININGVISSWRVSTKDYTQNGGHNMSPLIYSGPGVRVSGEMAGMHCSGNLLQTMPGYVLRAGTSIIDPAYVFAGGCLDTAQQNAAAKCVQISSIASVSSCYIFDGPAAAGNVGGGSDAVNLQ